MMITMIAAVSADGKIAQAADQSSRDWASKEDMKFFVEKTKELGVVIMGRKTFDTIGRPLKDRLCVIMTKTPGNVPTQEGVLEFTDASPAEIVANLEGRGYKTAALCGGAQVYGQFLRSGLVDEAFITVEPVLFGDGVPLATGFGRIDMELLDMTRLGPGGALLHYRIVKKG